MKIFIRSLIWTAARVPLNRVTTAMLSVAVRSWTRQRVIPG